MYQYTTRVNNNIEIIMKEITDFVRKVEEKMSKDMETPYRITCFAYQIIRLKNYDQYIGTCAFDLEPIKGYE